MIKNNHLVSAGVVIGILLYLSKFLRPYFSQHEMALFLLGFLPNFGLAFAIPFIYVGNRIRLNKAIKQLPVVCMITLALMAANEIRDRYQPGRVFDLYDSLASFAGVSLAFVIINLYSRMLNRTFTSFPILKTERLTLRQLATTDEQEIFTLRSDREINKYLNRQVSNTIDDARNFINKVVENSNKNEALYWAITLSNKNNRLIGTICLFSFSDDHNTCEIGYELLPNFQRQGIMQEAVEKVIGYAFNTINVQKIEAFVHRDNLDSVRLLNKFSFKQSPETDKATPELIGYYLPGPISNLK